MKWLASLALLATAGCATAPAPDRDFFTNLSSLCGKAFEGRITSPPAAADASFASKALVMHVRECSADTIRVPFHVADDHSRTWVITRTASGLRLKHDHRHKDGSEDKVTQYGGESVTPLSAARQEFPADAFTKELLIREGNVAGAANVWAVEVNPGRTFAYELRRPNRFLRVEFDLTRPVSPPPPAWGAR
ncbi:hypothetical protein [Sphingomonas sp.]|uniref:hypothetical protein n=1 Tax=Sphingomonas sp. TaxID=28214 RepID=UPI00286CADD1|nr:hypothetical protein [Sphingomonas sp.]